MNIYDLLFYSYYKSIHSDFWHWSLSFRLQDSKSHFKMSRYIMFKKTNKKNIIIKTKIITVYGQAR